MRYIQFIYLLFIIYMYIYIYIYNYNYIYNYMRYTNSYIYCLYSVYIFIRLFEIARSRNLYTHSFINTPCTNSFLFACLYIESFTYSYVCKLHLHLWTHVRNAYLFFVLNVKARCSKLRLNRNATSSHYKHQCYHLCIYIYMSHCNLTSQ